MSFQLYKKLSRIALEKFGDIVVEAEIISLPSGVPAKLRLNLADDSFVDVWLSGSRYSYHWQRGGSIFRHDNAPHPRWKHVRTFPKHFHRMREESVEESHLSDSPEDALTEFLSFIRREMLGD